MAEKHLVPVRATISRTTGEIRIDWAENETSFRKFGEIMLKIGQEHQAFLDAEARKDYEKRLAEDGKGRGDHVLL